MKLPLVWELILNQTDFMGNKKRGALLLGRASLNKCAYRTGMNFLVLFLSYYYRGKMCVEVGFVCILPDIVNTIFLRVECRNMLKLADCTNSFLKCG